ncbi:MAG: tyrosine-type recombinase/integrase [Ktedonobacterales bacterium]
MSTRRGNSEGTIIKRSDDRWEARITLPDGKRKSFYARTRQEAARRLAEALRDRDKGLVIVGEKQTLEQYLANWLNMIQPTVAPRTFKRYCDQVHLHIVPALGKVPIGRLSAQQVQTLYSQKLQAGMAPGSVVLLNAVLHRALDAAQRLGLVQRNITERADVPRKRPREMMSLLPEQARALLVAASGTRLEALYVLALTTGMREGELLALRWHDVDLEAGMLQVRATLYKLYGKFQFAQPKTARSRRKVALTALAVEALRAHRARQVEERLLLGPVWHDSDLVFCNTIGKPIERIDLVRRSLHPLLKKAGLPLIRFHDLRHTAATLLLRQGIHPKVVAEMLGHSQISVTLDTYSHVLPDMQREATAALDKLFAG